MSGGWKGSDRRERLPADWEARRRFVFERDGGQCTEQTRRGRCKAPATDCDHVVPGDDHSYANLTSLCGPHHAEKSAREGAAAREALSTATRRPPEFHPGRTAPPPPIPF